MEQWYSRTLMMFGQHAIQKLASARVAVFGVGGVGGYAVEALARSGVGALDIIDSDKIAISNLNRQILAAHSTVGLFKVDVAAARIADINPDCKVTAYKTFFLPSNADDFDFAAYDYVLDAIDTVAGKLAIIAKAKQAGVPVISCMGAGNKLDPTALRVADISETSVCPLAKTMRRELRKMGIEHVKVVYSKEPPISPLVAAPGADRRTAAEQTDEQQYADPLPAANFEHITEAGQPSEVGAERVRRATPASNAFVPAVAGLIMAGEVVKDICAE